MPITRVFAIAGLDLVNFGVGSRAGARMMRWLAVLLLVPMKELQNSISANLTKCMQAQDAVHNTSASILRKAPDIL